MQFREHQLKNGLHIIAECNPDAYSTGLGFFVDAGSRDETEENSGVSHFLEHMLFKGTAKRNAWEVNRDLDAMGSQSNAMTNQERTIYYAAVLPEFQDSMLELLSDLMRPALREEDFEVEKEVILEEIQSGDDQPPFGGNEKAMELYFGDHPLGRRILGTPESIEALKVEQMRDYFALRYSPQNVTLAAAGAVDFDALVERAEEYCGHWSAFPTSRNIDPTTTNRGVHMLVKDQSTQEYVLLFSDGPAADDEDRMAARVMATILGDDSGSRYYWELIDTGLAEYAEVGCYEYQGIGMVARFLCCAPEETAANLERMRTIEAALQRDGVTAEELRQAQNKICSHVALGSERPMNRLFALGVNWLQRKQYRTVRETVEGYTAVQISNITDVLQKYPLDQTLTMAVGPLEHLPS
ncbi:M16 family metallopeptidase [Lignipirellula cremea]|uniref:Insulinase (Peptidase family M16) n=1 Tax=Lignipirellula cremea TaxID=2528010 RepID=A0A518DS86_9BACT|nr:pitrilysin family protein [Lignipirellula cremea]QDU94702.1 Insulinase (Peptidase family M16) [Lignipirellula cremea]